MSDNNKQKHFHRLRRLQDKKRYMCTHPDCNFVLDKELLLGKRVACNVCLEPFILTRQSLLRAKPHCVNCTKTKERKIEKTNIQVDVNVLEEILKESEI